MAIAVDKSSIGSNGVDLSVNSTIAFTTNQVVASSAFIVISVGYWTNGAAATVSSVSGGSLSWTVDRDVVASAFGGGNPRVAIMSAQAPSGLASGTTITCTFSASLGGSVAAIGGSSFTGVKTSSPVDVTTANKDDSGVGTWATNAASIQAGSLVYGTAFNVTNATSSTATAGTEGYDVSLASGSTYVSGYRIEPSAGSYSVGGTWAAGTPDTVSVSVAYLEAAGGGGGGGATPWVPAIRRVF